jgi:hypothetical protein
MMTVYAQLEQAWPVQGLQGQRLGTIERCAIDIDSGVVRYMELKTDWQTIAIDWRGLKFDKHKQQFRLVRSHPIGAG